MCSHPAALAPFGTGLFGFFSRSPCGLQELVRWAKITLCSWWGTQSILRGSQSRSTQLNKRASPQPKLHKTCCHLSNVQSQTGTPRPHIQGLWPHMATHVLGCDLHSHSQAPVLSWIPSSGPSCLEYCPCLFKMCPGDTRVSPLSHSKVNPSRS